MMRQRRKIGSISTLLIGHETQVQEYCKTDADAGALLKNAVDTLGFSARSYGRILKVARTIADFDGAEVLDATHVSEAIQYRNLDRYKNL